MRALYTVYRNKKALGFIAETSCNRAWRLARQKYGDPIALVDNSQCGRDQYLSRFAEVYAPYTGDKLAV